MKSIELKNPRLEKLLSHTTELFYSDDIKNLMNKCRDRADNLITDCHPTSEEYLLKAFKLKLSDYSFPRACRGCTIETILQGIAPNSVTANEIKKTTKRLGRTLGTEREALSMYYPEDGFIGWHHNGNAPGYNLLVSYSLDGDGGFSYWDYKTKSVKTIFDRPGWNVKVGYYPNQRKEPERVYWHMAKTKRVRVSVAWIIDQKEMWKNMIDEITGGDYDHDDILDQ